MKRCLLLLCCLMLTACADDLRAGIHRLHNEITGQKDPDDSLPAMTRYCYKSFADVTCYTKPQPGREDQLFGYQEPLVPVGKVYDRRTHAPPHYDTSPRAEPVPPPPLKVVTVNAQPAVKGAEKMEYDPRSLEPVPLISSKR